MEIHSDKAICLRLYRYSETSIIVHWCSKNHGLLKTIAKGARSPKSKFRCLIDLFFLNEVIFQEYRNRELHYLKETKIIHSHQGIRDDYKRLQVASYFADLAHYSSQPKLNIPELYNLLTLAFGYISDSSKELSQELLYRFESRLLKNLGLKHHETMLKEQMTTHFEHIYSKRPKV